MKLRKLTALLAVLTLMLSLWSPLTTTAEAPAAAPVAETRQATDPLEAPLELLARLDNGAKLCAVYNRIVDSIQKGEDFFFFEDGFTLSEEEQLILQSVVDATFPESYGDYVGHSYCSLSEEYFNNYFYDWGLTAEMEAEVNQRVAELTADLHDKSDFDKCRILYERLIEENYYDFGEYHQTAYGALIEDKSVCAGYARAYQLLLQAVGIPCLYLTGTADNGYEIGGHAWNLVKLDGHWYYSDPTWDDHDSIYFGVDYSFFNISYNAISTNHFLDDAYELWVPKDTAPAADYYTKEGLAVQDLTLNQLITLFKKHNPLPLRILGENANVQTVVNLFYANVTTIANALGAPYAGAAYGSTGDASIVTLYLILDHRHEYQYETIEPTCYSYGSTAYACLTCGDRDLSYTDPVDHAYLDWEITETTHVHYCRFCGGEADYGEHTYHQNGSVCDTCGYELPHTVIPGDMDGNGRVNNRDLGLLQ